MASMEKGETHGGSANLGSSESGSALWLPEPSWNLFPTDVQPLESNAWLTVSAGKCLLSK